MTAIGINATPVKGNNVIKRVTVRIDLAPMLDGEDYKGDLLVFVHDLSTTPSTRILIENLSVSGMVEFEIGLVTLESETQDSYESQSMTYQPTSIYIHVADSKGYLTGGIALTFEAANLDNTLDVPLDLVRSVNVESAEPSGYPGPHEMKSGYTDSDAIDYEYAWLKAGEVHSISGLTVRWTTVASGSDRTVLYFQSYERTITYNTYCIPPCEWDSGWSSCGKLPTRSLIGDYVQASNNNKYEVKAYIKYACEEWYFGTDPGNPYVEMYYYFMYPMTFNDIDLGSSISCGSCNTNHPGYAGTWTNGSSNPFIIGFDTDTADNTQWKFTSVSFEFSLMYKTITFGVGINLYRAAGETGGAPPYLSVTVNSGSPLYYWHDGDDPTKYVVHFSWS